MPIYRGDGGSGESSTNAAANEVAQNAADAANSASQAATSATAAANSATAAASSATAAAASETAAETAETNAETAETNALASASAASASETNALTSETNAATSETNAATSASNASTSETNASASATAAATSASNAATSETNAATSATNAATSATNAATSETNAATSETNAATSATNAATSATNAAASYDDFDDRYLGAKSSDPSVDNDGDALLTGALYFNTTSNVMKVYTGSAWNEVGDTLDSLTDVTITSVSNGQVLKYNGSAWVNSADAGIALTDLSVTTNAVGTAALSYNNTNGVFSYTPPDLSSYLTSETDTLDSVTGRGATTTNAVTVGSFTSTGIDDNATSTAVSINSVGQVSVGITDFPGFATKTLTIGTSSGDAGFRARGANQTGFDFIQDNAGRSWIYNRNNAEIRIGTNDIERMRIDSSGNVGIGAPSPSTKLQVNGTSRVSDGTTNIDAVCAGSAGYFGTQTNHSLILRTNDAEVMRFNTTGTASMSQLLVTQGNTNTTFTSANDSVFSVRSTGTPPAVMSFHRPNNYAVNFGLDGADMKLGGWSAVSTKFLWAMGSGDFHADGNVVAYSTSVSDKKFKDDVQPITGALDTVDALQGVTFTWNTGSREGKRDYGLIAQEVEKVLPELVHETALPLITDDDKDTLYKTIDYDKLVAVLIEAVSELRAEVEELRGATN